jgi:hypothetical protein
MHRFLLLVAMFAAPAFAQAPPWNTNVITWTAHTTCSDGTAATNCPVTQWRIETAASATATTWDLVALVPATPLRYEHTNVTAGPHCYRVKGVGASGTGVASQVLASSCKTNTAPPPPTPGPPGPAVVTNVTAYEVRPNSRGVMVASRIGVVPTGTVCTQETRIASNVTYNRVDAKVDLINWPNRLPPTEVFARCATG